MKKVLTGIKPTGEIHIGNFLGSIKPSMELAKENDAYYFVANYHALTTLYDKKTLEDYTYKIAATWLSFLGDDALIYLQSDVPEIFELSWVLSCVTPTGLLERAHAYKDAVNKNKSINYGVFSYPVLMASDILSFDVDMVPVGKDQKQHVEIARDLAGYINKKFKADILKLPEPIIKKESMTIPGIDGQKMSKSYNNIIPIFEDDKKLRKIVRKIKTDSTSVEDKKNPQNCTIFNIYKLFASSSDVESLKEKYLQGGMGWGEAKDILADELISYFKDYKEKYLDIMNNKDELVKKLKANSEKARKVARNTLDKVRNSIGII